MPLPLRLSATVSRAAGRLSRLAGAGGGTTLPGKILDRLDPNALARLAARLPEGSVAISATNGKTTTAALSASVLARRTPLVRNAAGANLVSGIGSALLDGEDARLGLFEIDEGALPRLSSALRPRVLVLGNLFRDQLDRYGELEQIAERWRDVVAALPAESTLVVNADDPRLAALAEDRVTETRSGVLRFGIDDPEVGGPLPHAADAKYCVRCGTPYEYARAYVGHLGEYHCPNCGHERPPLDVVAREIVLERLDGSRFELCVGVERASVRLGLPGIYNVYNALAAAALCVALGVPLVEIVTGLESAAAAFGRSERLKLDGEELLLLLIKNPTGANEVVRTLVAAQPPRVALLALNDAIADGQDVSWIWDVDFEPLFEGLERVVLSGDRAAELALRFTYGGYPRERIELIPALEPALDAALGLLHEGEELVVCPTYTAMLELQGILARRGAAAPYWRRQE